MKKRAYKQGEGVFGWPKHKIDYAFCEYFIHHHKCLRGCRWFKGVSNGSK